MTIDVRKKPPYKYVKKTKNPYLDVHDKMEKHAIQT